MTRRETSHRRRHHQQRQHTLTVATAVADAVVAGAVLAAGGVCDSSSMSATPYVTRRGNDERAAATTHRCGTWCRSFRTRGLHHTSQ
jgi:hypothetical protein